MSSIESPREGRGEDKEVEEGRAHNPSLFIIQHAILYSPIQDIVKERLLAIPHQILEFDGGYCTLLEHRKKIQLLISLVLQR